MASLVRWDPFRDLLGLQRDVDRLFSSMFAPLAVSPRDVRSMPAMDVFSRDGDLVLRVEIPGIKLEDVDISVTDDVLTVKAERRENKEIKEEDYLFRETSYGTLERSLRLPEGAEVDNIHADYADGILEITVPKGAPEHGKTLKIAIETHSSVKELPSERHH